MSINKTTWLTRMLNFFQKKSIFILFLLSFVLWLFVFKPFLQGEIPLQQDADPYFHHTRYFCSNLSQGLIPLWDSNWSLGVPNYFILQRIGCFNPCYVIPAILIKTGFAHFNAYIIFLVFYHFLGLVGFYLLCKSILKRKSLAFAAYLSLLFSIISFNLFSGYTHLLFCPLIWLFYFLIRFNQGPNKFYFLGITLCLSTLFTTYIPFLAIIILSSFLIVFIIFYAKDVVPYLKNSLNFFKNNLVLTSLCSVFLITSLAPGYLLMKSGETQNFEMPNRSIHGESKNVLSINEAATTQFDSFSHIYFSRQFGNFKQFHLRVFFLPLFIYLVLFLGLITPIKKFNLFLLSWGIILLLVSSPKLVPGIHSFLFSHLFIYTYIRMHHFFLWISILPIFIIFIFDQLKTFLKTHPSNSNEKKLMLLYLILIHAALTALLIFKQNDILTPYLTVLFSFIFFTLYFFKSKRVPLIILSVILVIQPLEVIHYMKKTEALFVNPSHHQPHLSPNPMIRKNPSFNHYYMMHDTKNLWNILGNDLFAQYTRNIFILFDNLMIFNKDQDNPSQLKNIIESQRNVALVDALPLGYPTDTEKNAPPHPEYIEDNTQDFQLLQLSANAVTIKTNYKKPKLLVFNDSYDHEWRASINGQFHDIIRANLAFKGLWIPAGENMIRFEYGHPLKRMLFNLLLIVSYLILLSMIIMKIRQGFIKHAAV
jgi:hypothetical protein